MQVPTIALSDPDAATEMDRACREIGFFAIIDHGVPETVISDAWDAATAFFDLPLDDKLAVRTDGAAYPYGYFPINQESLGDAAAPDLNESFNVGPAQLPRRWPPRPEVLKTTWLAYYDAMSDLAARLMALFASGLGLDPTHFESLFDNHTAALRALNYPPQATLPAPGQVRAAPHTDYGTLTILKPGAATGGLEVQATDCTWVTVPPVDDGFVVNIGDMMQMWTNDRWRSTVHRVVNPDAGVAATERRQSMAFFHQPNADAVIECLPTCTDAANPPRHPPVTAGEWLRRRVSAAHDH